VCRVGGRGRVRGCGHPALAVTLHVCLIIAVGSGGGGLGLGGDDGGHSGGVRLPPHVLGVGKLVVLFELHSPVLKPNFDLSL